MNELPRTEGQLLRQLRGLFTRYGYQRYRMCRFEEYDLYARNRDFLVSDNIITFTDTNGRLMALKPDVTLSIVRASTDEPDITQKYYYEEKVYRVGGFSRSFQEITQAGVECIGAVDDYQLSEILLLAAESLGRISGSWRLCVSHLGVLTSLLVPLHLTDAQRDNALRLIAGKNLHGLSAFLTELGSAPSAIDPLLRAAGLCGDARDALPALRALGCAAQADQLQRLVDALAAAGAADGLVIDLSVVNGLGYYSGLVFHGYVPGVPVRVLAGGAYDPLMRKMNHQGGAVGFAVYLDELERLWPSESTVDADILLLYEPGLTPVEVLEAVRRLSADGSRVLAERRIPPKLRYGSLLRLKENGVITHEA